MRDFLLYWPFGRFEDVHWKKDPGQIPLAFNQLGYKSSMIVGTYNVSNPIFNIKVYDVGKSIEVKKESEKRNNLNFAIFAFNLMFNSMREMVKVFPKIIEIRPEICMIYNRSLLSPFIVFLYNLIYRNKKKFFILKMDSDCEIYSKSNGLIGLLLSLHLMLSSFVFDIISVETSCAYHFLRTKPFVSNKLVVLPDSLSKEYFSALEIKTREKLIITVARISKEKGIDLLIESFSEVVKLYPDYRLEIIGSKDDEEYYSYLMGVIKRLNILSKVFFLGALNETDLLIEYSKAEIFCLISLKESFGIARLEAIQRGLKVVVSAAGCGNELQKFGAIVVQTNNVKETTQGLIEAIKSAPPLNRSHIKTWNDIVEEIRQLSIRVKQ